MIRPKKESETGGLTLKSRLHLLAAQKEEREGRRISDSEIARVTGINRATISTYRTPYKVVERIEARVVTALCSWANCGIGDLLEVSSSN